MAENSLRNRLSYQLKRAPLLLSLISIFLIVYDFGFVNSPFVSSVLHNIYLFLLITIASTYVLRYIWQPPKQAMGVWVFDSVLIISLLILFIANSFLSGYIKSHWSTVGFLTLPVWNYLLLFLVFVREFSRTRLKIRNRYFNPALLFVLSFCSVIFIGTLLLLLPRATYSGISLLDAFFTSTSAVCVTGLMVVDLPSVFTPLGQTIILVLIQAGGLGIMTFTSFFAYFFTDSSSFQNQLVLRDLTNSEKMAEVFRTLKKIVALTFTIEAIGAVLLFVSIDPAVITDYGSRVYFAVFHSISAFCNAGVSTMSLGLYDPQFRYNYTFLFIVSLLFIIGGLGFPIVFNYMRYLKFSIKNRLIKYNRAKGFVYLPGVINLNTRIVIVTTALLVVIGTILMFVFEYDNTLREHAGPGKIVTAFFTATAPRTAGFNNVNITELHFSTIMIVIFLMWVGGSPASTAGGIKTSTLALATLNIISIARGKNRVEVFRREIADYSFRRAFAIIALSLIVIGFAVFLITAFDSHLNLLDIAFECFAAYSTAGFSLGITPSLSAPSKLVVVATMFIGRVGMLTLMVAFMRKVTNLNYRYPTEEILIN